MQSQPLKTTPTMQRAAHMKILVPSFREAIAALKDNPSNRFRLVKSYPARGSSNPTSAISKKKTVCILDSSVCNGKSMLAIYFYICLNTVYIGYELNS